MPLNLAGLPCSLGQVIERTLANEKCTPDFPLLMAESLEEWAELLPACTIWRAHYLRVAAQLREAAPSFAKNLALSTRHFTAEERKDLLKLLEGKTLGDFEAGTLTP